MSDYGAVKKKGQQQKLIIIGVAVLAAAGVAFLIWSNMDSRSRALEAASADTNAASIVGPPCPSGTAQGSLGRGDNWRMLTFNEVEFGRRIGHADCGIAQAGKDVELVCQFSAPGEIKVVTKTGAVYFEPGLGNPASVIVTGDTASCVMAAPKF